uniref:Putative secreted protein salivary gland overexpressed n=1 Tax=Rhipicephalus microplus TaxID=6941 RepID=A0A6M2DAS7_RHIMP
MPPSLYLCLLLQIYEFWLPDTQSKLHRQIPRVKCLHMSSAALTHKIGSSSSSSKLYMQTPQTRKNFSDGTEQDLRFDSHITLV